MAVHFKSVEDQVYVVLNAFMATIGTLASLLIIILIRRMKIQNAGHIVLVLWMSWCQLFYDATFFFSNVDCGYYVTTVANVFQLSCGIGSALVSNWIAFIAWYVVSYRMKFDVRKHAYIILPSCAIPSVVDAILYAVATIPQPNTNDKLEDISVLGLYYYTRLVSIGFNFVFCALSIYLINQMSPNRKAKSEAEVAIRNVAIRMIYYPIVQAVGRSGYAWYEAQYGTSIDVTDKPGKFACLIFLTIVTPLQSVGYLIIFLIMQPDAYLHFKSMLTGTPFEELEAQRAQQAPRPTTLSTEDAYDYYSKTSQSRHHHSSSAHQSSNNPSRFSVDWTRPSSFFFGMGKTSDVGAGDRTERQEGSLDNGGSEAELTNLQTRTTLIPFKTDSSSDATKSTDETVVVENLLHVGREGGGSSTERSSAKSADENTPLDQV